MSILSSALTVCVVAAVCSLTVSAQDVPTNPGDRSGLPPSSVLVDVLAPFERTRANLENWSQVELDAFKATTAMARVECKRLEQTPHEGEEALALARLCSVGMEWDGTFSAARWYTRKSAPPGEAAHLAIGFGLLVQADLNLQSMPNALDHLREVIERLPLAPDTDSIFNYVIQATEVMQPAVAVRAAQLRQPALLEAIFGPGPTAISPGAAEAELWHHMMLLHGTREFQEEDALKSSLLQAKAQRLTELLPADAYAAANARIRYEWLGKAIPEELRGSGRTASLAGTGTRLLIFQHEDSSEVPALAAGVDALDKRLPPGQTAVLVLQTGPGSVQRRTATGPRTVRTATNFVNLFGLHDAPVFVLADAANRVGYLGLGASSWLNPQAQAEVLLNRIAKPLKQ